MQKREKDKFIPRNERIRAPYVMLITEKGEKIERIETSQALAIAYDKGLDLVLVAPNVNPPVAKIMDWGKYKYELTKKQQQSKKQQKASELKEIRLRPKTSSHDLEIKLKKVKEFLEQGHKVKISMVFKGREVAYLDRGKEAMTRIVNEMKELAQPENRIGYQFKRLSVTLAPIKK